MVLLALTPRRVGPFLEQDSSQSNLIGSLGHIHRGKCIYMADDCELDLIRAALKQVPVREPQASDRVYKDECMFSFNTSLSPGGLYLNLRTWQSFGRQFLDLDHRKTGSKLYLHEVAHKVPPTLQEQMLMALVIMKLTG